MFCFVSFVCFRRQAIVSWFERHENATIRDLSTEVSGMSLTTILEMKTDDWKEAVGGKVLLAKEIFARVSELSRSSSSSPPQTPVSASAPIMINLNNNTAASSSSAAALQIEDEKTKEVKTEEYTVCSCKSFAENVEVLLFLGCGVGLFGCLVGLLVINFKFSFDAPDPDKLGSPELYCLDKCSNISETCDAMIASQTLKVVPCQHEASLAARIIACVGLGLFCIPLAFSVLLEMCTEKKTRVVSEQSK